MKNIRIIKNRSDISAGTRGADMGIDAMEIAAINLENDFLIELIQVFLNAAKQTAY